MKFNTKYISNTLSLRDPQKESLQIFEKICDALELKKEVDLVKELEKVKEICPTITSFERDFPSICFALATGIGKTRLMGALIAYLHYEKGINNFFVMAPNLPIYDKLKKDFSDPSNPKYVFKGLDAFVNPPRIIDGETYSDIVNTHTYNWGLTANVTINIFNIGKLNSESKVSNKKGEKGKPPRIKRLNEVLGESYFDYLKQLPDLCIFMDESHHYHADKSFNVINELQPILGVELTATPQIQKNSKAVPFKNVVYEYSLAHALKDEKYVKVPTVFTRKDFNPDQYVPEDLDKEKLKDGIKLHIDTKEILDTYARIHGKRIVKPFVLVVAKDTNHSKEIMKYICSNEFFDGYYKDKVLEIHSEKSKVEKDENIKKLVALENSDNPIEIVIHVNMLKEGWDVNNLYTIIPLRSSASETLTEQTIGRGLRLPYGERTGDDKVDRLSIVSHDKYEAIIKLANDSDSLLRKVYYMDNEGSQQVNQKETIELPSTYESIISNSNYTDQISMYINSEEEWFVAEKENVADYITGQAREKSIELSKSIKSMDSLQDQALQEVLRQEIIQETQTKFSHLELSSQSIEEAVEKAIELCIQTLTDVIIPIPRGIVQPQLEVNQGFYEFELDTKNMHWYPATNVMIGQELNEGGQVVEVDMSFGDTRLNERPENKIVKHIIAHDNIDYYSCADLIYQLIEQLKKHLASYLKNEEEVNKVLEERHKNIADNIYAQMNQHFYKEERVYSVTSMAPFSKIETGFGGKNITDKIYDYKDNIVPSEIKTKIFKGFKKSCHTMYKFDSETEKNFAWILEQDKDVLKWMCPALKQFNIYYDDDSTCRYQPDFIVETHDKIYMIETKARKDLENEIVVQKAKAATVYCEAATEYNLNNGGKPWEYAVIPHDEVKLNSSFNYLVKNKKKYN